MEHPITPITRTRARSTPISPRTPALGAQWLVASLWGLYKGASVQGTICEVRDTSVQVELISGIYGWAYGTGLGLDHDQQPYDCYREGDWVTAEVTGIDQGNDCVALSIRTHLPRSHFIWRG